MSKGITDERKCSKENIYMKSPHLIQKLVIVKSYMVKPKYNNSKLTY